MKTFFSFSFLAAMLLLSTQGFAAQTMPPASANAATPLAITSVRWSAPTAKATRIPGPPRPSEWCN